MLSANESFVKLKTALKFQGTEEDTYWLLRNQVNTGGGKPGLSSTDSKTSLISGLSLGTDLNSGEVDEVSELKPRVSFHTSHRRDVSIRTRVMMNPKVSALRSDVTKKNIDDVTSTETCVDMTSSNTGPQEESGKKTTAIVAELHNVDTCDSDASSVNIRI